MSKICIGFYIKNISENVLQVQAVSESGGADEINIQHHIFILCKPLILKKPKVRMDELAQSIFDEIIEETEKDNCDTIKKASAQKGG